ncbi:hypothetical protein OSB04_030074 [Centaurea solstitialis]|uniref:Wall-associated receptor kinase galacturonan-binding domain-containing protein n=1 Tax=Centaurea solstitialis TaxID=347529 RepID=A0AA38SJ53_9ASTR|nr:hypothetical protein OSB04_030074 [Centaurea solstitialis]
MSSPAVVGNILALALKDRLARVRAPLGTKKATGLTDLFCGIQLLTGFRVGSGASPWVDLRVGSWARGISRCPYGSGYPGTYYEACVPKRCSENGPNISYPFFIQGVQNSSCGYPGLGLNCRNGSPILRIPENDFRVEEIDYEKRHLRLQTTAVLPNGTVSCPSGIRNLTLDPNRFLINNDTTELVFISNCLNNTNTSLDRYRIRSCERIGELIMLATDTNLRTAAETCGNSGGVVTVAMLPVELVGGEGRVDGTNYAEVVERGFGT